MKGTIKVAALTALLVSSIAFAAEPSPDKKTSDKFPDFSTLDKNHDGAISEEEARKESWLASRFGEVDGDKNGKLSTEEYQKAADTRTTNQ